MFFGLGAMVTAGFIFWGFHLSLSSQMLLFSAVSLFGLLVFWKKTRLSYRSQKSYNASIIGQEVMVVEDIVPKKGLGRVELNGTLWQARADGPIKKGHIVRIIAQENLIIKVEEIN
jgi:membrane protein implicated in regulation of membrane protease activity